MPVLDLIWKFMKSGVMEGGLFSHTDSGVPQGGVISPLLANVYLNEFDQWAAAQWDLYPKARERRRQAGLGNYKMVRYADDFVVVSNASQAEVKATKQAIQRFLENELHLTLSEEKTVITHVNDGFDFLGFHIQRGPGGLLGADSRQPRPSGPQVAGSSQALALALAAPTPGRPVVGRQGTAHGSRKHHGVGRTTVGLA